MTIGPTIFERLKALSEKPGPLGHESEFNAWLKERWSGLRDIESSIVPPGTLLVRVSGSGPKVVLAAHADEVSFVVKSVSEQGLCSIGPGMPDKEGRPLRRMGLHIAGQPALVLAEKGPLEGVFTTVTGHVTTQEQRAESEIRWRDFWVDIGCNTREECEARGILPGTPILWNPPTRQMGHRIVGKAMDDRAGLAVLETILAELGPDEPDCELWLAATAMEECNALGAAALASRYDFDLAIVVDIGLSCDCPAVSEVDVPVRMGDGVVLVVKDNAAHYDIRLVQALEGCAKANGVKVQRASYGVDGSYASDGLRFIEHGITSALVAFPAAYTHSPFEMVDERDLRAVATLLQKFVQGRSRYCE